MHSTSHQLIATLLLSRSILSFCLINIYNPIMKVWIKKAGTVVEFVEGSFHRDEVDGEWHVDVIYDGFKKPSTKRYSDLEAFEPFTLPLPPRDDDEKENGTPDTATATVATRTKRQRRISLKTAPETAATASNLTRGLSTGSFCEIISPPKKAAAVASLQRLRDSAVLSEQMPSEASAKESRESTGSYCEIISPPKKTQHVVVAAAAQKVKRESSDSYCEIISPPKAAAKLPTGQAKKISDDIEELGVANEYTYIHARFDCPKFKFEPGHIFSPPNQRFCDKCYCWICDMPASECSTWTAHCSADGKREAWIHLRAKRQSIHHRFACPDFPFESGRYFAVSNKQHCDRCFCWVCEVPASQCTEWDCHCCADSKRQAWQNMRATRQDSDQNQG